MGELQKILVWNTEGLPKREARLICDASGGSCLALYEEDYETYKRDGFYHITTDVWSQWKPIPKKRLMVRSEILWFIQDKKNPFIVKDYSGGVFNPFTLNYTDDPVGTYQWADLNKDGTRSGDWHKFEVEE